MKIAISGASGYIGQHLSRFLTRRGYEIIPLNRRLLKEEHFDELCQSIECCNVVINQSKEVKGNGGIFSKLSIFGNYEPTVKKQHPITALGK